MPFQKIDLQSISIHINILNAIMKSKVSSILYIGIGRGQHLHVGTYMQVKSQYFPF